MVHWTPEIPNVKEFFKNIQSLLASLSFKLTNQMASFTQSTNNSQKVGDSQEVADSQKVADS